MIEIFSVLILVGLFVFLMYADVVGFRRVKTKKALKKVIRKRKRKTKVPKKKIAKVVKKVKK